MCWIQWLQTIYNVVSIVITLLPFFLIFTCQDGRKRVNFLSLRKHNTYSCDVWHFVTFWHFIELAELYLVITQPTNWSSFILSIKMKRHLTRLSKSLIIENLHHNEILFLRMQYVHNVFILFLWSVMTPIFNHHQ